MCMRLGRPRGCSDCEGRENMSMYNFTFDSIVSSFIFVAQIIGSQLTPKCCSSSCLVTCKFDDRSS